MNTRTIGVVRSLLMLIFVISIIGLVVWLICFLFGICGWAWGIISISAMLLSMLFFPHYHACYSPLDTKALIESSNDRSSLKGYYQKILDILFDKTCTYVPSVSNEGKVHAFSSIFAPAEVKRKSHMFVQVYLHLFEETEKVKALAKESDKNAKRRDYIPIQCELKKGDKVDVILSIYGDTLLKLEKKSVVWQGSFTKCSFDYFLPKDLDVDELSCMTLLTINEVPVGEMRFITKIVETPRKLNTKILVKQFKKVFISYSHADFDNVQFVAKAYKALGVKYFFDSDNLEGGDVFEEEIMKNIDSSDLFILCWSENAAKSKFIPKEIDRALIRAYPQKSHDEATLKIYPISIEPHATLPQNMVNKYHFERLG